MTISDNTKHVTRMIVGAYIEGDGFENSLLRRRLESMSDRDFKRFYATLQSRVKSRERQVGASGGSGVDLGSPEEILKQAMRLGVNLRDVLAACPTRKVPNRGLLW